MHFNDFLREQHHVDRRLGRPVRVFQTRTKRVGS
jgi:hypothetical protein